MARPRNADPERTRRLILEAAIRRFGERGLDGTSLRTIAGDAGVTFATVHHHFGCKADLFDRCLESGYEQLAGLRVELAGALAEVDGAAEDRIRALAGRAFRYAMTQRDVSRFLLRATLYELDGANRARVEEAQRRYLDVGSEVLGAALGKEPRSLRVPLQGLMFLLTRMAVMRGVERENVGASDDELEAYVGEVAVATLMGVGR